ncbi:MAG: pyridine nucleotide transhydrogenase [Alphaproteobacteria bacterium]|nr:pyridine nucleotide transhydrogenase [Alphaproteobacteria bacterium]
MTNAKNDALIGSTGFVGTTLLRQHSFHHLFRSTNIADIRGRGLDQLVCAGAPAQKWIANRDPDADEANISRLIDHLDTIHCQHFTLISTVDVFADPTGADEATMPDEIGLHPYGRNRLALEQFVAKKFPQALIVRLPGLVGAGLRKNVIFDFLNDNNLADIDSRGVFQFYPMANLWSDIAIARSADLSLIHLTAAPLSVAEVARDGFGREFHQEVVDAPARYDFRTRHAALYSSAGFYQYTKAQTLDVIRDYAHSEPKTAPD